MPELLKIALQEELRELATIHQVDPFSRKFMFGGDETYARLRNRTFALLPSGSMTLLRAMLRLGLDETRRASVCPSPYHLGSEKSIPDCELSLVGLARKVRKDRQDKQDEKDKPLKLPNGTSGIHIRNDPELLKKEFESITDALKKVTGTTIGKYEDKQNTLRVIYLLDRMLPNSGFAEERSIRLLTFINSLARGFSFEARDAYPIRTSEANTQLLNDLKAYLSIEIDNEIQDRIDCAFNSLIDRADDIRSHLDRVAYSAAKQSRIAQAYKSIARWIETEAVSTPSSASIRHSRLDMDLYLHLNRFEFLHFSGAHAEAREFARPPSAIASVRTEIIEALSALTGGIPTHHDTTLDDFWLEAFPGVANQHSELFLNLIAKALGFRPSESDFERSVSLAHELLYRTRFFGRGCLPGEKFRVSFRNMVSALCATLQAIEFRTEYRPRVFRDNSQARSILTPLESSIKFDGDKPSKEIPEGYLQIWHNRREWVQHALEGEHDLAEAKFLLRRILWAKLGECVQPNDIGVIEENLSKVEARLLSVEPGDLGT